MTADYYTDLEGFAASRWQASKDNSTQPEPTPAAGVKPIPDEGRRNEIQQLQQEEGDLRIHPRLT